ncbi:MAG: hypothetical protein ACRCZW_09220, partial [Lactobacillaceae bacterium]
NNIPLIEPSSNQVKSIGCNSLTNNTEKITNIVKNKSYDLYVGVGAKGYSGNKFIKIAFTENMSFLSNRAHCMNIFVSGLNDGGSPKHPKGQGQGDDVSSLLLNLRRRVSWYKDGFYYLKGKAGDNRVQNSFITRKKLLNN